PLHLRLKSNLRSTSTKTKNPQSFGWGFFVLNSNGKVLIFKLSRSVLGNDEIPMPFIGILPAQVVFNKAGPTRRSRSFTHLT
ncbi:MAG: hypothetical protein K9J16_17255, partial [Melioribacteraceae bacterium]|nr:hypothetical protein [Melioribacteraceae bacterium]MCF8356549.1 hypothetical protein [Melioribacteraceae bacterium]MCF8395942.1 hypothetical protein [Melioribacteraceae bacterium]MCF8421021.1 hypothetical protein [Melioribacteraceae bacterium]